MAEVVVDILALTRRGVRGWSQTKVTRVLRIANILNAGGLVALGVIMMIAEVVNLAISVLVVAIYIT